jgi:hypothetical protein
MKQCKYILKILADTNPNQYPLAEYLLKSIDECEDFKAVLQKKQEIEQENKRDCRVQPLCRILDQFDPKKCKQWNGDGICQTDWKYLLISSF